jgi:hypothetical protein
MKAVLVLLMAGLLLGQQQPDREKPAHDEIVGVVVEYQPGKTLAIRTDDGDTRTFEIGTGGVTIDENVKVGTRVRVVMKDTEGQKTLEVKPEAGGGAEARPRQE